MIGDGCLVLTSGYLMVESRAAEISTNDGRTIPTTSIEPEPPDSIPTSPLTRAGGRADVSDPS